MPKRARETTHPAPSDTEPTEVATKDLRTEVEVVSSRRDSSRPITQHPEVQFDPNLAQRSEQIHAKMELEKSFVFKNAAKKIVDIATTTPELLSESIVEQVKALGKENKGVDKNLIVETLTETLLRQEEELKNSLENKQTMVFLRKENLEQVSKKVGQVIEKNAVERKKFETAKPGVWERVQKFFGKNKEKEYMQPVEDTKFLANAHREATYLVEIGIPEVEVAVNTTQRNLSAVREAREGLQELTGT